MYASRPQQSSKASETANSESETCKHLARFAPNQLNANKLFAKASLTHWLVCLNECMCLLCFCPDIYISSSFLSSDAKPSLSLQLLLRSLFIKQLDFPFLLLKTTPPWLHKMPHTPLISNSNSTLLQQTAAALVLLLCPKHPLLLQRFLEHYPHLYQPPMSHRCHTSRLLRHPQPHTQLLLILPSPATL